jgi:transcriptional regulator with XRE-family HTH domain
MSHNALQENLQRLIKDRNYPISEIEKIAGQKRNSVYNIIRGVSKKPSAELLQAIADVFGVTVKDLYKPPSDNIIELGSTNLDLFVKITYAIVTEIRDNSINMPCSKITEFINEVYEYCTSSEISEPDQKFIKWLLKQKYSK